MTELPIVNNTLHQLADKLEEVKEAEELYIQCGRVFHTSGLAIEVTGLHLAIGQSCRIMLDTEAGIDAEVIGFTGDKMLIMPYDHTAGIANGMLVTQVRGSGVAPVSNSLLGRVVDAFGNPIDEMGSIHYEEHYPLYPKAFNPLKRARINFTLDVGVRCINALCTICRGQRMGIFAASGMGKSVLLGMMTKFTNADVVVVGLIGERGREVKEFIEEILGQNGIKKSVIVAVPADSSPLKKAAAAAYASAIAEYFRDQDKHVLLIIDSLTRYAEACREISLSSGEMPATKGFTPSVFARLSQLVERSGTGNTDASSITAIYTILTEDSGLNDPIAEHIRSLIDGHLILSRDLAEQGHYPAIDIERSLSRVMHSVVTKEQYLAAMLLRQIVSAYQKNKEMINIGMYQPGSDQKVDLAVKCWPAISQFLTQGMDECSNMDDSLSGLFNLIENFKGKV